MAVNYIVKKSVTTTVWKWVENVEKRFRIDGPIRVGRAPKPGSAIDKPADLVDVTDLDTNTKQVLIVGAVFKANLVDTYPADSYIGKTFAAVQGPKPAGKKYCSFTLNEIEVQAEPATKAKK